MSIRAKWREGLIFWMCFVLSSLVLVADGDGGEDVAAEPAYEYWVAPQSR